MKNKDIILPSVDDLKYLLTTYMDENDSLRNTITEDKKEIRKLNAVIDSRDREILALRAVVQERDDAIALLKGGRDSSTSSTSPSQDLGRSNSKSLRKPSDKKSGGQAGHTGHHLAFSDTPDQIIEHSPLVCTCCGINLEDEPFESYARRQIVDIPPVHPLYIEHRSLMKTCPKCGAKNRGIFPGAVKAPIQYGPVIEATTGYLSAFQYLPYRRIVHFFKDCYGLHLSEGSIDNFLENLTTKANSFYELIHERIQSEEVVGSDETGCRVNGKKHWFHVWQSRFFTFIVSFAHRSYEVVEKYFEDGFMNSFYVSDCYAAQLKTPAKAHQLCMAHLMRELANFEENLSSKWSINMKELLMRAWELKKNISSNDYCNPTVQEQVTNINKEVDELLNQDYSKFHKKEQALIKRLIKHRASILTFLDHEKVPPHNNDTEVSIRNVKVKTKVSGQFRNKDGKGADRYAKLRSVIDTTIKNGQDVYTALMGLNKGKVPSII